MKLLNVLEELGSTNTSANSQSRKETILNIGSFGKKIALATMPAAFLAALPKISMAANKDVIVDTLQFALTLEYLENEYYNLGLTANVMLNSDKVIFQQISKHESAHVTFLKEVINSLGATPANKPIFDFTVGGAFSPFTNYETFLALAQAFEDAGVRAYKGQAGNLISNNTVLTAALQIHSVEGRHASEVRRLRTLRGYDTSKSYISGNSRGTLPAATQAVYDGEENVTQGGVNLQTALSGYSATSIQEAFDEPLTKQQVLDIAGLFIV